MAFGTYRQYDSRWGKKNYNGSSNYANAGCGPTSCANILYAINSSITPLTTGNWMKSKGYAIRNNGTAWNGIPACLKAFGAQDVRQVDKMADVFSYCSKGYVGVFLFRAGTKGGVTWTTAGHYIAVTGYKVQNGKHYFRTFDSGGRKHDGWYCYETTMKGLIPRIWLCKVKIDPVNKPTGKYTGNIPEPTLKNGSKGNAVIDLQKFLNWYHPAWNLKTDGDFGSGTEAALRAFQETEGINSDGVYGKLSNSKAKLYIANNNQQSTGAIQQTVTQTTEKPVTNTTTSIYTGTFPTKTIKKGSKGDQVKRWQNFLKWVGYDIKADKVFGKITVDKTKAFQKKVGFTGKAVDGVVGPNTIKKAKEYKKVTPIPQPTPTPATLPMKCIDVSYWQGKISKANWDKIKKTCGYAICRASYTSQSKFSLSQDSTFTTNFTNAKAAGLKVGAYHYSQAISVAEAKKEAEYICKILKNYTPTFYVVCDFEYGGRLSSKIGKKASDIANAFCDVVKSYGYSPCIYANTSTLKTNLTNPKYPVWVAQYASKCTYSGSKVMWQYTSSGKVDGISAKNTNSKSDKVDLSYVYTLPTTTNVEPTPQPEPEKPAVQEPVVQEPVQTTASKYTGAFPDLIKHSGQKIMYTARDLAYAKGTAKSKYTYGKGKAKEAFTTAINAVYPKRSSWSKQCQAGASCDVGAGTIIRYSGIDSKVPRGLSEQIPYFKKSTIWKNTGLSKVSQAGDVGIYNQHIWIGLGDGNIAEANHTWKYFEHIVADRHSKSLDKKNWAVYRANISSSIKKGDKGTEVTKLQNFLNWAGFNCGNADGSFGDKTLSATKAFQEKCGLTVDGIVGSKTIEKAKEYLH